MTRRDSLRAGFLILLALPVTAADAADRAARSVAPRSRLAPVQQMPGPLAGYESDLRRAFREAFGPEVRLRALVRPSFETEYAVGLRQDGNRYEIFALRPVRQQVWTYQLIEAYRSGRAGVMQVDLEDPKSVPRDETAEEIARLAKNLPRDPADLAMSRCAAPVDPALAAEVTSAWRAMLEAVRADEELMAGADGTTYVFSMEAEGRALAGEAWSPRKGTAPARLARLADSMRRYCETKEAGPLREIRTLGRELAKPRS